MKRSSRVLAIAALSVAAFGFGIGSASAGGPPPGHPPVVGTPTVTDPGTYEQMLEYSCEVQFTVAYYHSIQQGFDEVASLDYAELVYDKCKH